MFDGLTVTKTVLGLGQMGEMAALAELSSLRLMNTIQIFFLPLIGMFWVGKVVKADFMEIREKGG
jgi:hypothetical protein